MRKCCLFLLMMLLFSLAALAQEKEDEPIRIESTLVNVPVVATDRQGRYVPGLQEQDFTLYENGARQQISFFSAETLPFHVVLLLDVSGSAKTSLLAIQRAARSFIDNLRDKDKVMIITFGSEIDVLNEFTANRRELIDAIISARLAGSTRLYDAVLLAARRELKKIKGRKALIVLTDGDDTSSYMSGKFVAQEAISAGVIFYAVQYPGLYGSVRVNREKGGPRTVAEAAHEFLQELADATGGRFFDASSINDLSGPMKAITEELRYVYLLGYYPENSSSTGNQRKIEVKLREHPEVSLRYKNGYQLAPIK